MGMENWNRICPKCRQEIVYSNKYTMQSAESKKSVCKSCSQRGKKKKIKNYKGSVFQKSFWINQKGMTDEEATQKVFEIQSKISSKKSKEDRSEQSMKTSPFKIETWIEKGMTKHEAEFEVKSRRKINKEYWIKKGFSEEEAIRYVSDSQARIARHSKSDDSYPTQLKYWIKKGFSEDDAKKKQSERQATFTLEKCISKYGDKDGRKKWKDRQDKWKAKVYGENGCIANAYSKLNVNIGEILENEFPGIRYCKNKEWFIWDKDQGRVFMYDLCKPDSKKIIEINGDFWHMNPKKYVSSFIHPVTKQAAQEKWNHDQLKIDTAKKHGYQILVIWESDYKQHPEQILRECKNFLK